MPRKVPKFCKEINSTRNFIAIITVSLIPNGAAGNSQCLLDLKFALATVVESNIGN
jgi:hypothetical protein